jgi:hypothetical protein
MWKVLTRKLNGFMELNKYLYEQKQSAPQEFKQAENNYNYQVERMKLER